MPLIIGTYTERLPHVDGKADGILVAGFDQASGTIGPVRTAARARNPSYLTVSADGTRLYAVAETGSFGGHDGTGAVAAYARDPASGDLTPLNALPSGGPGPCFVSLDRSGRFVLVANYGSDAGSVSVFAAGPDGGLGAMTAHARHQGSGPDPDRQAGPHAHMIVSDPVTGDVLVTDLGADALVAYRLDAAGRLKADADARRPALPGAGPRHLAFHPGGEHLFAVNELDSTVRVLHRDGRGWGWAGADRVPTLPPQATGTEGSLAAAIRVTPSGRHVLVSNRGHDSIAVFRFSPGGPDLTPLSWTATPGAVPRDLVVTPDGRYVVVACQDGSLLASYPFDDEAGQLGPPSCREVPSPACLAFCPEA